MYDFKACSYTTYLRVELEKQTTVPPADLNHSLCQVSVQYYGSQALTQTGISRKAQEAERLMLPSPPAFPQHTEHIYTRPKSE